MHFATAYLEGIRHITDWQGYDHMLFLAALSAAFGFRQWKSLLLQATAFTLGHSVTLAIAAFDVWRLSSGLVEFLIPCTIALTAASNLMRGNNGPKLQKWNYLLTLFFGLIHGMGFSTYFRMIMPADTGIATSLLAFNLGVETGQIIILVLLLSLRSALLHFTRVSARHWLLGVSVLALLVSGWLMVSNFPF